ncbi:MAG: DUF1501 domain-containing protein [Chloroflexi bacterium]|nr:DUF1501 domain-containing protein [Chloroflexota bacterium]
MAILSNTISRRSLLAKGATLVAAGMAVPSFIAETARIFESGIQLTPTVHAAGRRILVIIQLAGGNDGLNTVIPINNAAYTAARPGIAIPNAQILSLNGSVGLHPSLTRLKSRYDLGQVGVVQGVSYPNPNRSHFRGTDIWESAVPTRLEAKGWVGRYLETCGCQRADHLEAMTVGSSQTAGAFWTEMALVPAVASISNFRYTSVNNGNTTQRSSEIATLRTALAQSEGTQQGELLRQSILTALTDADILAAAAASYTPRGTYPANGFGNSMKLISQLVAADVGTSIFYVSLGGFDTHSGQLAAHASLMATLDQAVDGFLYDMEQIGKLDDVTLMTFSEFGRRVAQNGSSGTDHGVAAPMFVIGGGVQGGLHGTYPSLTDLTSGDLKMSVDFRSVYAAVLEKWLNVPSATLLEGTFPTLSLFEEPVNCSPRPQVRVATSVSGGRMNVTVTAGGGKVRSIRFGPTQNALIDVDGLTSQTGTFTRTFASPATAQAFYVRRQAPGPVTVPIVVTDDCGAWNTFVGGGAGTTGF